MDEKTPAQHIEMLFTSAKSYCWSKIKWSRKCWLRTFYRPRIEFHEELHRIQLKRTKKNDECPQWQTNIIHSLKRANAFFARSFKPKNNMSINQCKTRANKSLLKDSERVNFPSSSLKKRNPYFHEFRSLINEYQANTYKYIRYRY